MTDAQPEPAVPPLFSVAGDPTSEELAAVIAVLALRHRTTSRRRGDDAGVLAMVRAQPTDPAGASPRPRRLAPLCPSALITAYRRVDPPG